ncbi:MAG: DUF3108 domain-containing protein [Flavobacteriaceae bacterium]|nr:DUF3108 domain-containing protein [Flavobacteriaceae bacterium]
MKKIVLIFLTVFSLNAMAQTETKAFKEGEWLRFRISYSNFVGAGKATLEVKDANHNGESAYHVVGKGKTTGVISWFFKVRDDYQTYFYKNSLLPYHFKRKINEGGYTKNKEILFDHTSNKALVKDHKRKTEKTFSIEPSVQDMLSTVYYVRNKDLSTIKKNDEITLDMFFDEENYKFKLRCLGREVTRTRFGKVKTIMFRPIVQAGRVFKEQESVTVWISDDENKIPLRIKASLAVGSLRADLDAYKGLANPFPIIF